MPKPEDIIFTETDASWVHHHHEDALVITTKIANNLIHQVLIDSGSVANILYWNTYYKIWLKRVDLRPTTSLLYGFTRESVIPEGTIKLAITLGERGGYHSDRLFRGKLPISLQRSPRWTPFKDHESSHIHLLLDDEVPYHNGDGPSLRKTVGLKRVL